MRWTSNTLCKESRAGLSAHRRTCVRLRPGLGDKAFSPVTSSRQQQVVFGRPSGPAQVDVKLDEVGLDPLDLLAQHVLVGTGCFWGATTDALAPSPRCAVVPRAWAFGVSALQTPVMLVRQGDAQGGREDLQPLSAHSPAAWELTGEVGGKRRKIRSPPLPPAVPLGCCDFIELCIGLRRMELGNTTT